MKISFQTLIVSGVHNVDCVVPIYPLFLCFKKLAVDLQLLSWTQMRELKIKITFHEINNRNFVVSAGQLQFLTEMSRARNQRLLRNYRKSYRLVKLVIAHTEIQVNEAIKNKKAGKKKLRNSTTPHIIKSLKHFRVFRMLLVKMMEKCKAPTLIVIGFKVRIFKNSLL